MLSGHTSGDVVRYSEVFPALRSRGLSVERTTEVLHHIGVFLDDRPSSFDLWLESKLENGVIQPLESEHVRTSVAAVTRPADRLILALAAVHAARPGAIRRLQLDDLDIGNRRLVVDGRVRPWTSSRCRPPSPGWSTGDGAGPTPPTRTC